MCNRRGVEDVPIRPAATVVLIRDSGEVLQSLLVRRNSSLVFFAGSWVFPGGRIDPEDYFGVMPTDDVMDAAHAIAARVAAAREVLEEAALVVDPDLLVPLSHWTTPLGPPRRFATWFFIGRAPSGVVTADGLEIVDQCWMEPSQALARAVGGEIDLPLPTRATLEWLKQFATVDDALEAARRGPYLYFPPRGQ